MPRKVGSLKVPAGNGPVLTVTLWSDGTMTWENLTLSETKIVYPPETPPAAR